MPLFGRESPGRETPRRPASVIAESEPLLIRFLHMFFSLGHIGDASNPPTPPPGDYVDDSSGADEPPAGFPYSRRLRRQRHSGGLSFSIRGTTDHAFYRSYNLVEDILSCHRLVTRGELPVRVRRRRGFDGRFH